MGNIYDVITIESQIESIAKANQGEIPEELLKELVEAQTKSLADVENLAKYIRHLELGIESCDAEIARINEMKVKAGRRKASIKKYLTPYIKKVGKTTVGTFVLSTRKSTKVELDNGFNVAEYMTTPKTPEPKPDKTLIKADLKAGKVIDGASLKENDNLQIK